MNNCDTKPRVAVLEDHEDTRELLCLALQNEFSVEAFSNASDLLAALDTTDFSAIVADIMLPDLDGFAFIRKVRADRRRTGLCVIAVTALAMPRDREQAKAAGFDDYLVKPLPVDDVAKALWKCLEAQRAARP
jgi:CheY-like chemotaxis protein